MPIEPPTRWRTFKAVVARGIAGRSMVAYAAAIAGMKQHPSPIPRTSRIADVAQ